MKHLHFPLAAMLSVVIFLAGSISCQNDDEEPAVKKTLSLTLGEHAEGGIVFYISPNKDTAFIAATEDYGPIVWSTKRVVIPTESTFGAGTLGSGAKNTAIIVAAKKDDSNDFAARLADDLVLEGFDDWYLPDIEQLTLLYEQRELVGNFAEATYWSSSAYDGGYPGGGYAANYNFSPGIYNRRVPDSGQHNPYLIRPVRTALPK
ncbi:MAG: hypothetical protein LBB27_02765 [Tannerellaceae bacterium]|jgi:hypothetical protein|nr:hypothetical protein [Tannerellaceae bacterium]